MELLPDHLTITEFAALKGVERIHVYNAITAGKITADKIGKNKSITMINAANYTDYKFKNH